MSVINQMLKDLDQRQADSNAVHTAQSPVVANQSPIKIVIATALIVVLLCAIGFYIWQLNSENNALKAENIAALNSTSQENFTDIVAVKSEKQVSVKGKADEKNVSSSGSVSAVSVSKENQENEADITVVQPKKDIVNSEPEAQVKHTYHQPEIIIKNEVAASDVSKVTPAMKEQHFEGEHPHPHPITAKAKVTPPKESVKPELKAESKMTISRRQLTADELAKQKLALAEKALAGNQVAKAEKLLEDVVIITPNDSQTRKKLAALWFGRQAYQDAVNILSQGISLNNQDSDLREMKARIHLKQGQTNAAFDTLRPLSHLKNEAYQLMLANVAQQVNHTKTAISAYSTLIDMQPNKGRWHLGLAVLYDKKSQFTLATQHYKNALTKNDLSISSEQFVKQRIKAIGH